MPTPRLTIQHGTNLYEPPIEEGVQIEWERTGSPGKLTFTAYCPPDSNMTFTEGDAVCFYYGDTKVFMGYVFKKQRDKEHMVQVTCYDQIRYLKNKYTYVFEKKTATEIIKALCKDFNLKVGTMANTSYIIPTIVEENVSALDIVLTTLEETLLHNGKMFVLYDKFGELTITNVEDMISKTLIFEDSAENFDYTSSIDDETYNSVVIYYKNDDNSMKVFNAYSPSKISEWGTLRYFEEVKDPSVGRNKANNLLNLYCRKTRELKITGAFGDISVRAGTLIPVKLNIGDVSLSNYMLVEKVVHNFDCDHYTMDLTLQGAFEKDNYNVVYREEGEIKPKEGEEEVDENLLINENPTSGNAKADYMLKALVACGATVAGACGVLANVEAESNFNTSAHTGDGGAASGICQWHSDRWNNLISYCNRHKLNPSTIQGQTAFMIFELKQYPSTWSAICNGQGKQGARDAAYLMCVQFEKPANKESKGKQRSNQAEKWWGIYGG